MFELHNINYAKEFVRLHKEADRGQSLQTNFVSGIVKYEVLAAEQTRAFYRADVPPFAARKKLPTDPTSVVCQLVGPARRRA